MDSLLDPRVGTSENFRTKYNENTRGGAILTLQNPETLVASDSDNTLYRPLIGGVIDSASFYPLIEIRLLSTYRAKVRIRDLTYNDTTEDKFL